MTENTKSLIENFFTKYYAYKEASRRWHERLAGLQDSGLSYQEACDHPDLKKYEKELSEIKDELEKLRPHLVRRNLKNLGISDFQVRGVLVGTRFRDNYKEEIGRKDFLLSDLCCLNQYRLSRQLGREDVSGMTLEVVVYLDNDRIGTIRSDGRFRYEAAPDLRIALGWWIATDGGMENLIEFFDLKGATRALLECIQEEGTCKEAFDAYTEVLKRIFKTGYITRTCEGWCPAANHLWRIATRQLGCEQAGHLFAY